jgi:signal peptidase
VKDVLHHLRRLTTKAAAAAAILAVAAVALVTLGPRFLPFQARYVRSGSMTPTLPVGSLAFYTPVAANELHRGDVIVFHRPDAPTTDESLVTHRIARVEHSARGTFFVTKGDANPQPDPWRVPADGSGWRLRASVPVAGYAVGMLGSHLGHTWILALVAFLLGAYLLVEIWRRPASPATGVRVEPIDGAVTAT